MGTMEFDEFRQILADHCGERSALSEGALETGRKLADLPD